MVLLLALSCLMGALVGLRFNVKMIGYFSLAAAMIGTFEMAVGHVGIIAGGLETIAVIGCLQLGYFAAIVLGALGVTDDRIPASADSVQAANPAPAQETAKGVEPSRGKA